MNVNSSRISSPVSQLKNQPKATPTESGQQSQEPQEPVEKYESWVPLAYAAAAGGAIAVPTAVGAVANQFLGAGLGTALSASVVPIATAIGVGAWTYNGAKEEFNGHPILTGITTAVAAGAAGLGAMLLAPIGSQFGWTGVGVATAVGAVGAGVISAVGIHHANKKAA